MSARARNIRPGEALALDPAAVRKGRDAFFFLWSSPCLRNERVGEKGNIAVVHIRGPLDHHADYGDSYDAIRERVGAALSGKDVEEEREDARRYGDSDASAETEEPVAPPSAVVLRIDSPGGVVAGLNECVRALRKMAHTAKVPLIAYIDELAASAAYAIASACDEIYLPASAIAGSVGVISTMVDQTALDKKLGLRVVTITSGARKADGHPHVPISDAAIAIEQRRVDKLAAQFFGLVQASRGLSPKRIASYQAGIFLGAEAVAADLADGVMSWEELVEALSAPESSTTPVPSPAGSSAALVNRPKAKGSPMSLKLKNLIAQTKAAISAEKDKPKRRALKATLAEYQRTLAALHVDAKTTHTIEHKEKHVADDGKEDDVDDGSEDDDEDDEDEESEESAEGNETDRGDDPEDDEEDEEAASEESEEEAAAPSILRAAIAKAPKGERAALRGALAALERKSARLDAMSGRVAALEHHARAQEKASLIDKALVKPTIAPPQARMLRQKPLAFVREYLGMHTKKLLSVGEGDLARQPNTNQAAGTEASKLGLSEDELKSLKKAQAATPSIPLETFIANYREQQKAQNGAGSGRY